MNDGRITNGVVSTVALALMSGCAIIEDSISPPEVVLTAVKLEQIGFSGQTFKLSFDVSNPNGFPLPVNLIDYGVKLDGYRFASGETECDILVPARGETEFDISVELDLLRTAPALLAIVRDSGRNAIPYSVEGRVGLDIPATRPLGFEHSGAIRMTSVLD